MPNTRSQPGGGLDGPLGSPLHVRVLLDGRLRVYKVAAGLRVADVAAKIYPEVSATTDFKVKVEVVTTTTGGQHGHHLSCIKDSVYTRKLLALVGAHRAKLEAQLRLDRSKQEALSVELRKAREAAQFAACSAPLPALTALHQHRPSTREVEDDEDSYIWSAAAQAQVLQQDPRGGRRSDSAPLLPTSPELQEQLVATRRSNAKAGLELIQSLKKNAELLDTELARSLSVARNLNSTERSNNALGLIVELDNSPHEQRRPPSCSSTGRLVAITPGDDDDSNWMMPPSADYYGSCSLNSSRSGTPLAQAPAPALRIPTPVPRVLRVDMPPLSR